MGLVWDRTETNHCFDSTLVDFIIYAARSTTQVARTVVTSLLGLDQNINQYQPHQKLVTFFWVTLYGDIQD